MKRLLTLATAVVVVACWPVLAAAGNGNGSTPPGQEKKAEQPATQPTAQPAAQPQSPGQAKQAHKAASSTPGVKPSNSTSHNTSCQTTAGGGCQPGAKHDSSKQYGNGKTAAQIATSHGAPAGTTISGPGNSQPHKVTSCKHKHAVDVHAVKSYSSADCSASAQQPTQQPAQHEQATEKKITICHATGSATNPYVEITISVNGLHGHGKHADDIIPAPATGCPTAAAAVAVAPVTAAPQAPQTAPAAQPATAANGVAPATAANGVAPATAANGTAPATATASTPRTGVLAATATRTRPTHSGTLGRLASVATRSTLPFTGFPLWIASLIALALIAGGLSVRRATPTRN